MIYSEQLTKNKALELQAGRIGSSGRLFGTMMTRCDDVFSVGVSLRFKGDHCGWNSCFILFGFIFEFNIHDVRHWDWVTGKPETYGEKI